MSFKSNKCLQQHMKCKRHTDRMNKNPPLSLFKCDGCGRKYCHRQSLHTHKMSCKVIPVVAPIQNDTITSVQKNLELKMDEIKQTFEKERQEMKAQIDMLLGMHERNELKDKIANKSEVDFNNNITHQKSRDKRRKISKVMRQQIIEKQQNTCGECKQLLSPYFQLDHIIGLQFGGTDEESNLMALCGDCHNIKSIYENKHKKDIQEYIHSLWSDKRNIGKPV